LQNDLFLSQLSDNLININGTEQTVLNDYLGKFKDLDIIENIPCQDFIDDYDFNQYVKTDISEFAEIEELEYNNEFNTINFKLKI
jgi:hypothetical protein